MSGYSRIPEQFKADHPRLGKQEVLPTPITRSTTSSSPPRAAHCKVIQQAGGKVTDSEVVITVQKPKAPKLEQWSPGIPERG